MPVFIWETQEERRVGEGSWREKEEEKREEVEGEGGKYDKVPETYTPFHRLGR